MRNWNYLFLCLFTSLLTASGQQLPEVFRHVDLSIQGNFSSAEVGDVDGDGCDDMAFFHQPASFLGVPLPTSICYSSTGTRVDVQRFFGAPLPPGLYNATQFYRLADLDGDGADEFAAFFCVKSLFNQAGALQIRSGMTNAVLADFDFSPFPTQIVVTQDRNNDGIPELLLAYQDPPGSPTLKVDLIDGATLTRTVLYCDSDLSVTQGLLTIGDIDNDGTEDFAIGTRFFAVPGGPANSEGIVRTVSGATGAVINNLIGSGNEQFGESMVGIGDVDGDGADDFAVYSLGFVPGSSFLLIGRVQAFSSATGALLYSLTPLGHDFPIKAIQPAGDVNGDGFKDFIMRTDFTGIGADTSVRELRSGLDGSDLATVGASDDFVGDLNGDCIADWVAPRVPAPANGIIIVGETFVGGSSYGPTTGNRSLEWIPVPFRPQLGYMTFSGAQANAPLLGAFSLQPANTIIGGTTFPLLISPVPGHLILTYNPFADATGSNQILINLFQPNFGGLVLYFQYSELGATPGTTNAVELLLNDF